MATFYRLTPLHLELIQGVWEAGGKGIQVSFSHISQGYPCLKHIVEKAAFIGRPLRPLAIPSLLRSAIRCPLIRADSLR